MVNRMYLEQGSSCGNQACKIVEPVYIDTQARIASTAVIGPNVSIGPGCIVGEGVRIKEAILLRDVVVKDHVCILNAIIGWGSRVGEWARVQGSSSTGGDEHLTIKGVKKPSVAALGTDKSLTSPPAFRRRHHGEPRSHHPRLHCPAAQGADDQLPQ